MSRDPALAERSAYVRRCIAERRRIAEELRGGAIGATVEQAGRALKDAAICDAIAEGMERALSILFP